MGRSILKTVKAATKVMMVRDELFLDGIGSRLPSIVSQHAVLFSDDEYTTSSSEPESVPEEVGRDADEQSETTASEITGMTYESNPVRRGKGHNNDDDSDEEPVAKTLHHESSDDDIEDLFADEPMGGSTPKSRKSAPRTNFSDNSSTSEYSDYYDDRSKGGKSHQSQDSMGFVKGGNGLPTVSEGDEDGNTDDGAPVWSAHADPFASRAPPTPAEYRMRQRMKKGTVLDEDSTEASEYTDASSAMSQSYMSKSHLSAVDRSGRDEDDRIHDRDESFRDEGTDRTDDSAPFAVGEEDRGIKKKGSFLSNMSQSSRSKSSKKSEASKKSRKRGKKSKREERDVADLAAKRDLRDDPHTDPSEFQLAFEDEGEDEDPSESFPARMASRNRNFEQDYGISNANSSRQLWDESFVDEDAGVQEKAQNLNDDGGTQKRNSGGKTNRRLLLLLICLCCLLACGAVVIVFYFMELFFFKDEESERSLTVAIEDELELWAAVDAYLEDNSTDGMASTRYGYPIGSWDVSRVTSFVGIFDALGRNPAAEIFNEDISEWNTARA